MMTRKKTSQFSVCAALSVAVLTLSSLMAQTPAAVNRVVGTVTAINNDTLTVKPDSGDVKQVQVPVSATVKRVEPGQKDLSSAETIQLSDLATGDRVLVRLDPNATGDTAQATQIITIKAADVAKKQQQDREDWTRSGVGGLVKSVDAGSGVIVVTSGAGPTLKVIQVHVSKTTALKRYAPASVRYDLAQPASIDVIQAGDQLRARGTKSADGADLNATEIISGSFRNISGIIASLDAGSTSFSVKDLLTKKQLTIHVTTDAQMHALPEPMARMIAARLKGNAPAVGGAASSTPSAGASAPGGQQRGWQGGNGQSGGPGGPGGGAGRGADMQTVLNRAPAIRFSDLKKGDAVMLVATSGGSDVTAITLLTGVEPLLEAPEASRNLLANWSMGGGGGEGESQ
ncbi:MAG TPA: DUF5666 domain-containing protein [Terracidiphilus sp.]|nr:DUF5666 domain-containing protein [Terracidiphilus sp.]